LKIFRIILQIIGAILLLYVIYKLIILISAIVASTFYPTGGKDPTDLLLNSWQDLLIFSGALLIIRLGKQDEIDRKAAENVYQGLKEDKRMQY